MDDRAYLYKVKREINGVKYISKAARGNCYAKCEYDEAGSIGKRYRRQDAIGTPYCITVDHQTLEDGTVTLRERDSMDQRRLSVDELEKILSEEVSLNSLLRKLL